MTASVTPAGTLPAKRKRPFGVNAIIVLSTLSALYGVGAVVVLYFDLTLTIPTLAGLQLERWLMIYFIATSVVQVFIVIGLLRLRRWGWFLVMLNTGVGMVLNIWAFYNPRPNYIAMAVSVLIVFYMNQRDVQQAFIDPAGVEPPHAAETRTLPAA